MGQILEQLGNRSAGELIRAKDFNDLVAALDLLVGKVDQLTTRIGKVEGDLAALASKVTGDLAALTGKVDQIARQIWRVTLKADRTHVAVGELATLTATVSDMNGAPLDLSDPQKRPWVDFLTPWGLLRPAPGFAAAGRAGRSLSVQVDAQGQARVLLGAEVLDGATEGLDDDMAAVLGARLPEGARVAEKFLTSDTPVVANLSGAFSLVTQEYERSDATKVRSYLDAYYLGRASRVAGKTPAFQTQRWEDIPTTVLAVVTPDNAPTTADASRGASTIQLLFRDWIPQWIGIDYIKPPPPLIEQHRRRFEDLLGVDFDGTLKRWRQELDGIIPADGILRRQRIYGAVDEALRTLTNADKPFLEGAASALRGALGVQRLLAVSQEQALGELGRHTGLDALVDANAAVRTGAHLDDAVKRGIADMQAQFQAEKGALVQFRDQILGDVQAEKTQLGLARTQLLADVQAEKAQLGQARSQLLADFADEKQQLATTRTRVLADAQAEFARLGKDVDAARSNFNAAALEVKDTVAKVHTQVSMITNDFAGKFNKVHEVLSMKADSTMVTNLLVRR